MRAKYPLGRQPRLQEVSAIFAQWRSSRKPRSRIPEHLWQAAVDLTPFYSMNPRVSGCHGTTNTPSPACRHKPSALPQSRDNFGIGTLSAVSHWRTPSALSCRRSATLCPDS